MNKQSYDVLVIGGGVAGISAALWCDELGLSSTILEANSELGGQLLWTYNQIENHLGTVAKNGKELKNLFVKQIKERKFKRSLQSKVVKIDFDKKSVLLESGESLSGKALIIATGVKRRTLDIPGKNKFQDNGILISGKRDKDLVKDKRVIVIGGGDAALENTLILSETAAEVFIAHRRNEFRGRIEFIEAAKKNKKVTFLQETILKKIEGNKRIEIVSLENTANGKTYSIPMDAVLFRIGVEPNTKILEGKIELNQSNYIKVTSLCETNLNDIYAVGDVANPISPTISSAVGMGSTAVKAIYQKLKTNE